MKPLRLPYTSFSPDTASYYANGENSATNCMPYLAAPNYSQSKAPVYSTLGGVPASAYSANAVTFNTGAYLSSSSITGLSNGKSFSASIWFRNDTSSNHVLYSFNDGTPLQFFIQIQLSGIILVQARNSGATTILNATSNTAVSVNSTWHSLLISVNLATGAFNMFIDGVSNGTTSILTNDTIAWVGSANYVGYSPSIGVQTTFSLSEVWWDSTFIDFSVLGNRALFRDSNNLPVNLGSTGQTPTGASPKIYLKSVATNIGTNSGTGGNFTTTGVFSVASSSPSAGTTFNQALGSISCIDSSDSIHTYFGNSNALAEITPAAINNLSKSGGYTALGFWKFAVFTNSTGVNNVYATDFNDNIQVMTIGGTVFADLAGSPPKAKHIGQVNQFIMVGNTNGWTLGGVLQGAVPNRVVWCQIGNPANWPDPLTLTGIQEQAGWQDLPLAYGAVQHITNGQLYGLVFQEHAITNFYYQGGGTVFQVNTFEKQRGLYCPNATVQVGDDVYFPDQSGFFAVRGGSIVEPIGHDQVDNTWLADVNTAYLDHVRGSHDAPNKCIWWSYPSTTATTLGGFVVCDKVIVYNYADRRWAMGYTGQSIDILFSAYSLGYTMEQLDAFGTMDTITPSLDSPFWNGGQPIVGLFGIQQIGTSGSYASYYGGFTGTGLTATIDTKEVQLNEGGLALVNNVNPVVMGATLSNISMACLTRNKLSDTPTVGASVIPSTRTGKVPMRANARYHVFRTTIAGGFDHAMGVEPEFTNTGQA